MNRTPLLEARNVSVAYDDELSRVKALHSVSLSVGQGEFLCVLGPSGCGKTTLLRVLSGLIPPSEGKVVLDGEELSGPSRRLGFIFQQSTLFPWLTIKRNIDFALKSRELTRRLRDSLADELLKKVGLDGFGGVRPEGLSGGMNQRANLARTLAIEPQILLMDEPFGSLDAISRLQMHEVLLEVWNRSDMSIVFVTHDVDEAVSLADRILILTHRPGTVAGEIRVTLDRPRITHGIRCDGFEEMRNMVASSARDMFRTNASQP